MTIPFQFSLLQQKLIRHDFTHSRKMILVGAAVVQPKIFHGPEKEDIFWSSLSSWPVRISFKWHWKIRRWRWSILSSLDYTDYKNCRIQKKRTKKRRINYHDMQVNIILNWIFCTNDHKVKIWMEGMQILWFELLKMCFLRSDVHFWKESSPCRAEF